MGTEMLNKLHNDLGIDTEVIPGETLWRLSTTGVNVRLVKRTCSYYALDQETCCLLPGMPLETGEATVSHESPALNEHRIAARVPYDIVRPSGTRVCRSTLSLLQELACIGEPKFQAWVLYQRPDKDPLPCRTRTKELGWVLR